MNDFVRTVSGWNVLSWTRDGLPPFRPQAVQASETESANVTLDSGPSEPAGEPLCCSFTASVSTKTLMCNNTEAQPQMVGIRDKNPTSSVHVHSNGMASAIKVQLVRTDVGLAYCCLGTCNLAQCGCIIDVELDHNVLRERGPRRVIWDARGRV